MAKKQSSSPNALSEQKHRRRQWLTFLRMCRYGINSFTRNTWLTIAATAVMTVTLLVIFVAVATRTVLSDTVATLRDKTDMSIYLTTGTTQAQAQSSIDDLHKLSSVRTVSFESSDQARTNFVQENKTDPSIAETVNEATNEFPATIHITVQNIDNTSQLSHFVDTDTHVKPLLDPNHKPSFAGDRRAVIQNIGRAIDFVQEVGVIMAVVFISMSVLVIFNTIRMAIFNRREEIQMMKLIGAEPSFIRGPFLVEAIFYGFIAALIASGLGYALLFSVAPALEKYDITVQPTLNLVIDYGFVVVLAMIIIGALVGIISSSLATRRYLKIF